MNYELAKELKDAGFPQHGKGLQGTAYYPTLEELIEALPQTIQFQFIRNVDRYHITTSEGGSFDGSTPTEPAARLWLALNKKV